MPLDAICLGAVTNELNTVLTGCRIEKVYQPDRDEIVIQTRGQGGARRLLVSIAAGTPRVHFIETARENPAVPPMFCMLLRKHVQGAKIAAVTQPAVERMLSIELDTTDEMGVACKKHLICELMGKHSNVVLCGEDNRIIDAMRRVDGDLSGKRQVLPGLFYRLPPAQEKLAPSSLDRAALESALAAAPEESQADKWLLDTFGGLSPLICRELAFRAGGATDARLHQMGEGGRSRLLDELEGLLRSVQENSFTPVMLEKEGHPSDFTFQPISQYGPAVSCVPFPSFSALLDRFYEQRENQERVHQRGQDLIRSVTNARDRAARKIGLQEQELAATRDRERLRQFGDIITSNLHAMEKGMSRLTAADFYDPECPQIHIPLDPLLTPQQNAAKYYKEYNKAKTAESILTLQLEKGRRDLDYLNSVLEAIALAEGERDLQEIRQELTDTGYLRRPSKARDRGKRVASKPMEFRSSSGLRISVGKNNTQNDLLTTKQAFKSDLWFHTQKIHGSHVILWTEGGQPDLTSIQEAAQLAAWFSQGRASGKVAVDYTPVKYVKKPGGARPGMVVYTTYETAYVAPDGELARRLRVK